MARFAKTSLLALIIFGGIWALLNRDRLRNPAELLNHLRQQLALAPVNFSHQPALDLEVPLVSEPVIRVASFKLNGVGTTIDDTQRLPMLTEICARYDAIALQGIDGRDDAWLQLLTESLQAYSKNADYFFITDQSQHPNQPTQNAILFNRRSLDLDHLNWYTVNDPENLLRRKPLVGWFRTRLGNPAQAFTFTLVNVEFTAVRPDLELAYLGDLFRAIRNDGRGEDDVILAGDFNSCDRGLAAVQQRSGLTWVVSNRPTDVRHTGQFDNMVFSPIATVEHTGRGGVFDFMRMFNLGLADAEALSNRLPVWAEFSVYEGGVQNPQ